MSEGNGWKVVEKLLENGSKVYSAEYLNCMSIRICTTDEETAEKLVEMLNNDNFVYPPDIVC